MKNLRCTQNIYQTFENLLFVEGDNYKISKTFISKQCVCINREERERLYRELSSIPRIKKDDTNFEVNIEKYGIITKMLFNEIGTKCHVDIEVKMVRVIGVNGYKDFVLDSKENLRNKYNLDILDYRYSVAHLEDYFDDIRILKLKRLLG